MIQKLVVPGGSSTTAVAVAPNGNVGIGVATPSEQLEVNGNLKLGREASLLTIHDRPGVVIQSTRSDGTAAVTMSSDGWGTFQFSKSVSVGWDATIYGFVGIGTTSPQAKLDIIGTVKATAFQGDGSQLSNVSGLAPSIAEKLVPVGTVVAFAGGSPPDGWLVCDGRAVSRSGNPALWAAIGTSWGAGDGSTTFNIPDLRGLFLRGVDHSQWVPDENPPRDPNRNSHTAQQTGGNSGNSVGSVQPDEFMSHKHEWTGTDNYSGGGGSVYAGFAYDNGRYDIGSQLPTDNPRFAILNNGGSESRPKNAYVNYIIKF